MPSAIQPQAWISSERAVAARVGRQAFGSGVVAARRSAQGLAMPTVSGETLALPLSNSIHAFACTAGKTAFCAASPYDGANSAPRLAAYFLSASLFEMFSAQMLLERPHDLVGNAFGNEDAEVVGRRDEAGDRRGQRRDRAVAFELERLVADGGERAQPLAADHVGLLDRELGR